MWKARDENRGLFYPPTYKVDHHCELLFFVEWLKLKNIMIPIGVTVGS